MAANATAVWRVRPSGSNTNGGGFDCALSSAATGTNGSFSGTTFTDATAAAFTSGMAGSAINIVGVGQYLISAYISATQITLSGGNPALTLAGPLTWTVGSGQDYSQQNGAQVSQSNTANTSTATTTLTDTGAAFTSALIGNGIWVSGTGITTTFTYITAVPSGTTLTLQTSPGAVGTVVSFNIGGGWADFFTNTVTAKAALVAGNIVYLLGSGTPNPSSYSYDYTLAATFAPVNGSTTAGAISFINDPATPGYKAPPDTTGGMPCIHVTATSNGFNSLNSNQVIGLWFVGGRAGVTQVNGGGGTNNTAMFGCVFDQLTWNNCQMANAIANVIACEAFNSGSASGASTYAIASVYNVIGCNIHDFWGGGITSTSAGNFSNNILANNQADGIKLTTGAVIMNNTIDGNLSNGIEITTQASLAGIICMNNIISNHTQAGKYGFTVGGGTAVQNISFVPKIDYNVYYNNTANYNAIAPGPHDTALGSDPYVGRSTENYALA